MLDRGGVRRGDKARAWLRAMTEEKDPGLAREAARLLRAGEKPGGN